MKFVTDFLIEDYRDLCWYQVEKPALWLSVLLTVAFSLTITVFIKNIMIFMVLLCVLYPIVSALVRHFILKRADRRFFAFGASSELSLDISDTGIVQTSNSGETELLWNDVFKVGESESAYYVFLTKRKAFYFPKRSFADSECEQSFISILKKHISDKKIKLMKK